MEISKVIVGLEVHVELKTLSKMFCSCSADHFGKEPNSLTCPTCLGLPGALPVPNKKAIDWTILLGVALGGEIQKFSRFDRKNYFYPDLAKGYQISQYDKPFVLGGSLLLDKGKKVRLRRVHLEEDTGKLLHQEIEGERVTLIDFNRSGVPLVEIVSEPDLNSSEEVKEYLEKIQQLVRYLEISDADMEKGSLRCEPNVNLEIKNEGKFFYTPIVELKNINSFRFARKAIDFEIDRQFEEFQEKRVEKKEGNKQTRGWDEVKQITVLQREKEEANDYRYFPEPDIPPIQWDEESIKYYVLSIKNYELPWTKKERFIKQYGLIPYQAKILTEEKEMADYYEKCVKVGGVRDIGGVEIANVIINKRAPENLEPKKLIKWIASQTTSGSGDEKVIEKLIDELLDQNPQVVESYKKGKVQALGVIVGQIKRKTGLVVPSEKIIARIKVF